MHNISIYCTKRDGLLIEVGRQTTLKLHDTQIRLFCSDDPGADCAGASGLEHPQKSASIL